MSNYKHNCTKGPVSEYAGHIFSTGEKRNHGNQHDARLHDRSIATVTDVRDEKEMNQANATLIAEAFDVLHETGMTPRELADDCAKLLRAMKQVQCALAADRDGERYIHPEHGCLVNEEVKYCVVDAVINEVHPGWNDAEVTTEAQLEALRKERGWTEPHEQPTRL